jgi:hypothetical protein
MAFTVLDACGILLSFRRRGVDTQADESRNWRGFRDAPPQ